MMRLRMVLGEVVEGDADAAHPAIDSGAASSLALRGALLLVVEGSWRCGRWGQRGRCFHGKEVEKVR